MTTFTNARLFDGRKMLPGRHTVRLEGNRIASVSETPTASDSAIDLGGLTLMPGLISCHLHPDFYKYEITSGERLGNELPPGVLMAIAVRTCRVMLESGFTGYVGASCAHDIDAQLKMAIADDIIPGPRIRACGHHIGTTGDLNNRHHWWKEYKTPGIDFAADTLEGLKALVRKEISRGVETIKIFAGAGHGIPNKTKRNMASDEIATIVNAAHERGAKVRAHVSDKDTLIDCIRLGVDIIDHGDDVDAECIEEMVKRGTFWVPSMVYLKCMLDLGVAEMMGASQAHFDHVRATLPVAQKAGVRILIGDDYSGVFRKMLPDDPLDHQVGNYGREFQFYGAMEGLDPADVLSWGTANAGELLVDAPDKAGVIAPGALADLIVVDGDPVADLSLLARPQETLKAVIRDGAFAIDRLPPRRDRLAA